MSNATHPDRLQCATRSWCDQPGPTHTGEHDGEADLPKITATGDRSEFLTADDGISVPEVITRLIEWDEPSNTVACLSISLTINTPASGHANARLTLDEATLLRDHLTQLLEEPVLDRAAGLA